MQVVLFSPVACGLIKEAAHTKRKNNIKCTDCCRRKIQFKSMKNELLMKKYWLKPQETQPEYHQNVSSSTHIGIKIIRLKTFVII